MSIKERFLNLVKAFSADPDDLFLLEEAANNCLQYVAAVVTMELKVPRLRVTLDGADYRAAVQELDSTRKIYHDGAIAMLTVVGRLAKALGEEPLFDGDLENRTAVGDFCGALVQEFFDGRVGVTKRPIGDWVDAAKKGDGV